MQCKSLWIMMNMIDSTYKCTTVREAEFHIFTCIALKATRHMQINTVCASVNTTDI